MGCEVLGVAPASSSLSASGTSTGLLFTITTVVRGLAGVSAVLSPLASMVATA